MQLPLKATDSGYQDRHLIGVTPQQYTTYTPPVAHAWGQVSDDSYVSYGDC